MGCGSSTVGAVSGPKEAPGGAGEKLQHISTSAPPDSRQAEKRQPSAPAEDGIRSSVPPLKEGCFHVYLTREWGDAESPRGGDHLAQQRIAEALRRRGLTTWFGQDSPAFGDVRGVVREISRAVHVCAAFIVAITPRYLERVDSDDEGDLCSMEFGYVLRRQGARRMIPIALHQQLRSPETWSGSVGTVLGGKPCFGTLSHDAPIDSFEAACDDILAEIIRITRAHSSHLISADLADAGAAAPRPPLGREPGPTLPPPPSAAVVTGHPAKQPPAREPVTAAGAHEARAPAAQQDLAAAAPAAADRGIARDAPAAAAPAPTAASAHAAPPAAAAAAVAAGAPAQHMSPPSPAPARAAPPPLAPGLPNVAPPATPAAGGAPAGLVIESASPKSTPATPSSPQSAAAASARRTERDRQLQLAAESGVTLRYLREFFTKHVKDRPEMTTNDVVEEVIKPATVAEKSRYASLVPEEDVWTTGRKQNLFFISHAFRAPFRHILEGLEDFFKGEREQDVFVWLDILAINQHDPASELDGGRTLARTIALSKYTLVVLDSKATPFSRLWCLYEVSVTPRDKLKLLTTGFHARSLATVIQAIDVRKADCFNARDKEFILGAIHDEHKNLDRFADLIQSALGRQLAEKVQPTLEATSLQKVNAEVRPKAVQEALACRFDSAAKALARELMSAAEDGNLSRVQSLLNRGAPVDGSPDDGEGGRALWQAAYEGHSAVVRLLLEHGADPNLTRTKDMTSPLTVACFNGHVPVVQYLLECGADPDHLDINHRSPLILAASKGYRKLVEVLLQHGANVDIEDDDGDTPLLRAALAGDAGTLRILLDKHASLDHYVGKDRSPLEAAASQGYLEACEVLIKHGAKADARDLKGSTPLHMACQNGSVAIAEMMLATAGGPAETEAMANLARDDGVTPIIIAAHNGSMELLEVLLSKGAQVTRQATRGAPTALHAAVQGGHVEMTKRLLDLGVDVNVKKQYNVTPLMTAIEIGHLELIQLLCEKGADLRDAADKTGQTGLHQAIGNRNLEAVKVLLKHKNPLDVRNRVGRTPLGLAAAHNYEGACLLIAAALMNERYLAKDVLALQQRATEPLEREVLSRVLEQKKAAVGNVFFKVAALAAVIDSDTNDEGEAATQGPGGPHFYCGRRGKYSCPTVCGDECGPMGCQCPSCRRWSLVNGKPVFQDCRPLDPKEQACADAALQHHARFFPRDEGAWPPRKESDLAPYFRRVLWDAEHCGEGAVVEEGGLVFAGREGAEAWVRSVEPLPASGDAGAADDDEEALVSYWRCMFNFDQTSTKVTYAGVVGEEFDVGLPNSLGGATGTHKRHRSFWGYSSRDPVMQGEIQLGRETGIFNDGYLIGLLLDRRSHTLSIYVHGRLRCTVPKLPSWGPLYPAVCVLDRNQRHELVPPEFDLRSAPKMEVGARVTLAGNYEEFGDAERGPLKPGLEGLVTEVGPRDGSGASSQKIRVAMGRAPPWWYDREALRVVRAA